MLVDVLLFILVLALCILIAWRFVGPAVLVPMMSLRTGGARTGGSSSTDPLPEALALLDQYAVNPDATAQTAHELASSVVPGRSTRLTSALLDAIRYHWLYSKSPTIIARTNSAIALTTLKSVLSSAQRTLLTIVRDPAESRQPLPTPASCYLEIGMSAHRSNDDAAITRKNIELRASENKLREVESTLRATEAELRAARDDIRRLRDAGVGSLSSTAFLAECNADRKSLQERVYALQREIATALARPTPPNMQSTVDDLRQRNQNLEAQLRSIAAAPSQDQVHALQSELSNCRRLLDEVLSAQ